MSEPTPSRHSGHVESPPPAEGTTAAYPPGPQYANPPSRGTSGFAIASLVLGLLGGAILAVVFGHVALNEIKTTGKDGRGLAIAGLVLGYIETAFWLVVILLVVIFAAA